jgi:hypothetical protein
VVVGIRYTDVDASNIFTTANEIHIPVGVPVTFTLHGADVIHSFWVPNLAGKKDLIPGKVNTIWLQADKPGVYRGQCAEYCGLQHAQMAFWVVANRRNSSMRGDRIRRKRLCRLRAIRKNAGSKSSCQKRVSCVMRLMARPRARTLVQT